MINLTIKNPNGQTETVDLSEHMRRCNRQPHKATVCYNSLQSHTRKERTEADTLP